MKTYYILILLCIFNYVKAQDCGELDSTSAEGIINSNDPQQISTFNWLNKDFSSVTSHPDDTGPGPGGEDGNCGYGIQVSDRDGMSFDSAYYSKNHYEPTEIRFKFILDTENLLQNFLTDDKIVLYRFMYTNEGVDYNFLKTRLIKSDPISTNFDWELKFQWFDVVNGVSSHQVFHFNEADSFVEFEFFWNKLDASDNNGVFLFSELQAGVIVTAGLGTKPVLMISPYDYDGAYSTVSFNLEGESALGYINSNNNPAQIGDEIRIISPNLYNN